MVALLWAPTQVISNESDLAWSTFLGSSDSEGGNGIAVDASGNVYVIGSTRSSEFPATSGAFDTTYGDKTDAFVLKVHHSGSSLDYSTYLGGSGGDRGFGIAVDDSACAWVTGFTYSANFPVTAGAYNTEHNSPGGLHNDIFVTRLDSTGGALLYSTFLGGNRGDGGYALALADDGSVYITGDTRSLDFPVTPEAYDTSYNGNIDVFVAKVSSSGGELDYATFLGGSSIEYSEGIALDESGGAHLTGETQSSDFPATGGAFDESYNGGHDAFMAKIDPSGSLLEYSTFIGSSLWDRATGLALGPSGCVYLTGYTNSSGFPHTWEAYDPSHNGGRDAFLVKLDISGGGLIYATFLGGGQDDRGSGVALDDSGCAYLIGRTTSEEFPSSDGAFDTTHNGEVDVFVAKISSAGDQLLYATFLGGESYEYGNGLALGEGDEVFVTGLTNSSDFPSTAQAYDPTHNGWDDVFVTRLALNATSVATSLPQVILPGEYVLRQNYPNPFNPETSIGYFLSEDEHVTLRAYDVRGALVATLVDGHQTAGDHVVTWSPSGLASGVYFCVFTAGDVRAVRKMVLLK
jgi:hypothetical protein